MYPFKTVITTVKMAKSKLHPTFIKAHVYPGTVGTCNFYPAPRKREKGTSTIIAPHTRSGERQKHELLVTWDPQRTEHFQCAVVLARAGHVIFCQKCTAQRKARLFFL